MMNPHIKPTLLFFTLAGCTSICLAMGGAGTSFQGGVFETGVEGLGQIETADFDGDGHLDICIPNSTSSGHAFTVLYGEGTGLFPESVVIDHPEPQSNKIMAVSDLNQDGIPDVMLGTRVAAGDWRVLLFHGVDQRQFEYQGYVETTGEPRNLAAADLNGDGHIDLAASCEYSHTVEIFLSDGAGGYLNTAMYNMTNPREIVFADLDQDMDLDMVVGHNSSDGMSVRVGLGDGTFGAQIEYGRSSDPGQRAVQLVDFNDDGDLDVVTVSPINSRVIVRYGNPNDASFYNPHYFYPGATIGSIAVEDFDQDGHLDILTRSSSPAVYFFKGTKLVDFEEVQAFQTAGNLLVSGAMATGDMNSDGFSDIVVQQNYGKLQIMFNSGLCLTDTNFDKQLNFFDVNTFLDHYAGTHPAADFTSDGSLNFLDVSAFLAAFAAGCP